MSDLKRIIRPFETPDYSPPRAVKKTDAQPAENVVISVGRNGRGKTFTTSSSFASQRYMTKQIIEKTDTNIALGS